MNSMELVDTFELINGCSRESQMKATVYQEFIRGRCMFAAWVRALDSARRIFAPSRKDKKKAEADCTLLVKLALAGPSGEEIAAEWRNGKCGDREAAQSLKRVSKKIAKRAAGADCGTLKRRPSLFQSPGVVSVGAYENGRKDFGDVSGALSRRRYRVTGKRPYSCLFKCAATRESLEDAGIDGKVIANVSLPATNDQGFHTSSPLGIVSAPLDCLEQEQQNCSAELKASPSRIASQPPMPPTNRKEEVLSRQCDELVRHTSSPLGIISAPLDCLEEQQNCSGELKASPSRIASQPPTPPKNRKEEVLSRQCDELVRTKVHETLLARLPDFPDVMQEQGAIEVLAHEIAAEFRSQLENTRSQLRTLLWNLRDVKNQDFFRDVVTGVITPTQLPGLPSDEMASKAQRAARFALQDQYVRENTLQRGPSGAIDPSSRAAYKAIRARR